MAELPDKLKLKAANGTLDDSRVRDEMAAVGKDVCVLLPDTIITKRQKQEIDKAIAIDASNLILMAIQNSRLPTKLDIFLEKLEDKQPVEYEAIEKVYLEYLAKYSDKKPQPPQGEQKVPQVESETKTSDGACGQAKGRHAGNANLWKAVRETIEEKAFIDILGKVDKGFWYNLQYTVISTESMELINAGNTTNDVVFQVRQALRKSLEPRLVDILLEQLRDHGHGTHADIVDEVYQEKCKKHGL